MTSFWIEGAIAVRVPALGEGATHLPWLSPCAASLLALARLPAAAAWSKVRHDPGAVLLIARQTAPTLISPAISFFPAILRDPVILDGAIHFLSLVPAMHGRQSVVESENSTGTGSRPLAADYCVDWYDPALRPIYHQSLLYGRLAERIADLSGRCDADNAWVAGLLAPLGWMAVCALEPAKAAACLADSALVQEPATTQQRHWGMDQGALARRLARIWRLPRWLALVIGHLGLPVEVAQELGVDADLFRVVQMAVGLAQQAEQGVYLPVGTKPGDCAVALGMTLKDQETLAKQLAEPMSFPEAPTSWEAPRSVPLLADLLRLATENLHLREAPTLEQLEQDRDELHHALEKLRSGEAERLQTMKLHSLAEFAAG